MATVTQWLDPLGARIFTSVNPPELVLGVANTNAPISGYAFDGGTSIEGIFFEVPLPNYGASNPNFTVLVDFYTSATTNATVWQAAIAVTTPGDAVALNSATSAKTFATANAASAVTSNSTATGPSRATITITNLDSAAANDRLTLKLFRDPTNAGDTNTADAVCFGVWFQYPDT